MKAKFHREAQVTHPQHKTARDIVEWRRKLDRGEISPREWFDGMYLTIQPGTVIDHPHAHMLVKMGLAHPHDKECHAACQGVDSEATAEGHDRLMTARLTGDPRFDADDDDDDFEDDDDLPEGDGSPVVITDPDPVPIVTAAEPTDDETEEDDDDSDEEDQTEEELAEAAAD